MIAGVERRSGLIGFQGIALVMTSLLILLVFKGGFAATALAAGVSVPLFVIVLKVAGRLFVTRLRASGPGLPEPRS